MAGKASLQPGMAGLGQRAEEPDFRRPDHPSFMTRPVAPRDTRGRRFRYPRNIFIMPGFDHHDTPRVKPVSGSQGRERRGHKSLIIWRIQKDQRVSRVRVWTEGGRAPVPDPRLVAKPELLDIIGNCSPSRSPGFDKKAAGRPPRKGLQTQRPRSGKQIHHPRTLQRRTPAGMRKNIEHSLPRPVRCRPGVTPLRCHDGATFELTGDNPHGLAFKAMQGEGKAMVEQIEPMQHALALARQAAAMGEVPVGAVIIDPQTGEIVGSGYNLTITQSDPTAHAEIVAIREAASRLGNYRLPGLHLYVTLEPCAMCAGAISFARLARVIYAAPDPKGGALLHGPKFFEQPTCHWRPEIAKSEAFAAAAGDLLRTFFKARRG